MRLLVIRTSAMGDVALMAPILREMKNKYPDTEIVVLTRSAFKPFFKVSATVSFFAPDFNKRHKGLTGLFRLFNDLKKHGKIDHVIDLHDVIRSKILRLFFRFNRIPVSVIDKGRREKKALTQGKSKEALKHTVIRYCDAFAAAGFNLNPVEKQSIFPSEEAKVRSAKLIADPAKLKIGVAPYAKHKLKVWPEENMINLLNMISARRGSDFYLFGGMDEAAKLNAFMAKVPGSVNLAGKLSLEDELSVMSMLDFVIAMDSSNMHMAALTGIKVISIWGGTDPLTGFGAWLQPDEFAIRIPVTDLTCRPCTTFGKGECWRGDFACMNWLTPESVFQKIVELKVL